ncbi:MAG: serine/threonine-protein kinase [Myxococcota bacterium]
MTHPEPGEDHAITRHDGPVTHAELFATTRAGDADPPPATVLPRGCALGRYLVVDRLGAGGMGVVYRAFDPDLDRSVALKLVRIDRQGGSESDHERARLLREAQAMARLSHPNVIPVFDVGVLDDTLFVAMELVDGVTLGRWLSAQPRSWEKILAVFRDAGDGLAAAHAADLIHRDFKPDNVMIGHDDRVRVLDFGLARATGSDPTLTRPDLDDLRASTRDSLQRSMTAAGAVLGTPAYMSPEQHLGSAVGAASDQFSFCVALYEALYGARPFEGKTMAALSLAVLQGRITMPAGAKGKAPGWVLAVIERGLAVDPEQRFPSMAALLETLGRDPSARRRRVGLSLAAAGVLGVGTLLGTQLGSQPSANASGSPLCTGAKPAIATVWSASRREQTGEAFTASGLGFATETWAGTADTLDAWAQQWVTEHTAACRATRVTGEQSLSLMDQRMACLDRQRQRMDALVTALAEPDAQSIGRAYDAARRLPDPALCGDLEVLQATTPPPEDPDARRELAALRAELDGVRAQLALGHVAAAREPLSPLLPRVQALDFPPLTSEALGLHAELLEQTGEIEPSRRARERAHAAAIAAGDPAEAADHARAMVFTVGYRLADPQQGQVWLELGHASLRRLGGEPRLVAQLSSAQGAMLVAAGRHEAGLAAHERARAYWQEHEPQGPNLASVLDDIGAVHVSMGRPEAAVQLHRESLRLKRLAYGEHHPSVASSARELGSALGHAHQWNEALEQFERALTIERQARGERTQFVAALLDDIGRVMRRQDRLNEAIAHHRQALEIWEAVLGDPHPDLAVSVLNVGYTFNAAGRFEDALAQFLRALHMFEATVGHEHPYIVYASNSVASALIDLGRHDQARPHLERVLAMTEVQVDPTLIAETMFALTHALWGVNGPASAKARARALKLAREALERYQTQAERWGPQIEQIEAWLARHA